jgi:hypothetical protein
LWGDFREKLKIARTSQKSHLVKTSYTAVNEKGEFAGNVQFVAGAGCVLLFSKNGDGKISWREHQNHCVCANANDRTNFW